MNRRVAVVAVGLLLALAAGVLTVNETLRIRFGLFQGVLVTRDWSPLEPGVAEHKHYAPGIGLAREEAVEGESYRVDLVGLTKR